MELAGKYSKQPTVADAVALAKSYAPGKQLAAGDAESELVARLIPAAMNLGLNPGTVVQSVVGKQ